jgi:hypothetical protein
LGRDGKCYSFWLWVLDVLDFSFGDVLYVRNSDGQPRGYYHVRWGAIEQMAKGDAIYQRVAVENAAALLDRALIALGVNGNRLGERVFEAAQGFSQLHKVFGAVKYRNDLTHDGLMADPALARKALTDFRAALEALNIL